MGSIIHISNHLCHHGQCTPIMPTWRRISAGLIWNLSVELPVVDSIPINTSQLEWVPHLLLYRTSRRFWAHRERVVP